MASEATGEATGRVGTFDSEAGRKAAYRSAEVRRRKAQLTPLQRAEEAAGEKAPELVKDLLDAALGRGDFEDLEPQLRLKALFRALEYGVGKPAPRRPAGERPETTEPVTGDDLFAPSVVDPKLEHLETP